jgi:hypothetical protein
MLAPRIKRALPAASFLAALLVLGCFDNSGVGKTVPVKGRVTINDEPLSAESATVLFKPDKSKGNASPFEPTGKVEKDGSYSLVTKGKRGAPPGWYRVIVTATDSRPEPAKDPKRGHPHPRSLVPAKYGQEKTSNLSIEVVESPAQGSYDLKLNK